MAPLLAMAITIRFIAPCKGYASLHPSHLVINHNRCVSWGFDEQTSAFDGIVDGYHSLSRGKQLLRLITLARVLAHQQRFASFIVSMQTPFTNILTFFYYSTDKSQHQQHGGSG